MLINVNSVKIWNGLLYWYFKLIRVKVLKKEISCDPNFFFNE